MHPKFNQIDGNFWLELFESSGKKKSAKKIEKSL
jgi:hypothetical protein